MSEPPAVAHMSAHILRELAAHRAAHPPTRRGTIPPLLVGVQGPQGSGKTYLTSRLRETLTDEQNRLEVAVLSIDDLYLPHAGLVAVAEAHPHNRLLQGRGQPGTHDVKLAVQLLEQLRGINDSIAAVSVPHFDKSLFDGEGDRDGEMLVSPPVDVVILEGWCVGFHPVSEEEIDRRWARPVLGLGDGFFERRGFRKEDVLEVNEQLKEYVSMWERFHAFIQIKADELHPYEYIYRWRLEQEHNMKAQNGGKGMTNAQVETFVDRYIPGYVFFGDGVGQGSVGVPDAKLPWWIGHGLKIQIGPGREVVNVSKF